MNQITIVGTREFVTRVFVCMYVRINLKYNTLDAYDVPMICLQDITAGQTVIIIIITLDLKIKSTFSIFEISFTVVQSVCCKFAFDAASFYRYGIPAYQVQGSTPDGAGEYVVVDG